jgi:hypothetical protein
MEINKIDLIITNGDSFTDGAGTSEQYAYENNLNVINQFGWPEILSKKLNIPLINLAKGGSSNEAIMRRSIAFLEQSNILWDFVMKNKFLDLNLNECNILFITQYSYLHRINIGVSEDLNQFRNYQVSHSLCDELSKKSKHLTDGVTTIVNGMHTMCDYGYDSYKFTFDYFMYNSYFKTKTNILHLNWGYLPFNYITSDLDNPKHNYEIFLEKCENNLSSFEFKMINKNDVYMGDVKTCIDETNGVINDTHYGLHSNELMVERLSNHLKESYGIQ